MEKIKSRIIPKENRIVFSLDTKVYCLETIYSAAYSFLDRVYVYLDGDPEKEIIVSLKGKENFGAKELKDLEGEFHNELLNSLLRTEVTRSNQKIREYIVASALVSGLPPALIGAKEEQEELDWRDDPLGIAVPWEKKNKIKKKK